MKNIMMGILLVLVCTACGVEQIDEGYRGIKQVWGKVDGEPLNPGLYFYNPFSSNIREIDVREHKYEAETECFTKDTQRVIVTYVVTYYPEQAQIGKLYSQFGLDWDGKIVNQAVLGSMKDVIGQYIADDLVSKREHAKKAAEAELKVALKDRNVVVTRLDFTNINFDKAYESAVEAKVVAIQRSSEAKNKTVQVEEEAKQKIMAAQADAKSMQIKSEALRQNKGLIEYETIQKWSGILPTIMMGNSIPFLNLDLTKYEAKTKK